MKREKKINYWAKLNKIAPFCCRKKRRYIFILIIILNLCQGRKQNTPSLPVFVLHNANHANMLLPLTSLTDLQSHASYAKA